MATDPHAQNGAAGLPANLARFSAHELQKATGGIISSEMAFDICGVVTDSRAAHEGCLFVALKGERYDGHAYVSQAVERGAKAVVVEKGRVPPSLSAFVVEVADTLHALGSLAMWHRRKWGGKVVAVTGSAGKTTTKEMISAALAQCGFRVHRTQGNFNNRIGLPLTLLQLSAEHGLAVVELGTSLKGEIARLAEIAMPDVGVGTLVAAAHTEGLGSLDGVAEEKGALFLALGKSGAAVWNVDDARLTTWAVRSPAKTKVRFGRSAQADVQLVDWFLDADLRCCVRYQIRDAKEPIELRLRLLGEPAALNAAAALSTVAALRDFDIPSAVFAALESVEGQPGRMAVVRAPEGTIVLDDSYNANPSSMRAALRVLAQMAPPESGHGIAVLADMLELGSLSTSEHEHIGQAAVESGVRTALFFGTEMRRAFAAAQSAVQDRGHSMEVAHFDSMDDLLARVSRTVRPKDVVLVKGSRSMGMERVVQLLAGRDPSGGRP